MRRLLAPLLALFALGLAAEAQALSMPQNFRLVTEAPAPSDRLRLAPELDVRLQHAYADAAQALQVELPALDTGGGAGGDDALLGFILGILPGFGLGHLVVGDDDGFLFFVIVDVAVIAAGILLSALVGWSSLSWAVMVVGWIGIHVMQGLDAFRSGGGRGRGRADLALPPDPREPLVAFAGEGPHALAFTF